MPFNVSPFVLYRGHIIKYESNRVFHQKKISYGLKQCNDMKTFFRGASQEDILGLAISLIFDQFSIL